MNRTTVALFSNASLTKRFIGSQELKRVYSRSDFWIALQNYFAFHRQENFGFWIDPIATGKDEKFTIDETLFITSDFEGLPAEDREGAVIIDKVEVDSKELSKFFIACDIDKEVVALSHS